MPRGIPKAGFRKPRNSTAALKRMLEVAQTAPVVVETDEEIEQKLADRFEVLGMIDRGSKLAPHLQALVSRSHYVDLAMKSKHDYIVRIRQVVRQGLLKNIGLTESQQREVCEFIETNQDKLRELSRRMALKLGAICRRHGAK